MSPPKGVPYGSGRDIPEKKSGEKRPSCQISSRPLSSALIFSLPMQKVGHMRSALLHEDDNGNRFYDHELTQITGPDWLNRDPLSSEGNVVHQTNQGIEISVLRDYTGVNDRMGASWGGWTLRRELIILLPRRGRCADSITKKCRFGKARISIIPRREPLTQYSRAKAARCGRTPQRKLI